MGAELQTKNKIIKTLNFSNTANLPYTLHKVINNQNLVKYF